MWNGGRIAFSCGLFILIIASAGCQRGSTWELVPVEGTITKNGRPLRNIEVIFLAEPEDGPMGPRATGRTDAAGHYRLRNDNGEDGAAAGKHRVLLFESKSALMGRSGGFVVPQRKETAQLSPEIAKRLEERRKAAEGSPQVPLSYRRFHETPLRVEVHPGIQTLDFQIP